MVCKAPQILLLIIQTGTTPFACDTDIPDTILVMLKAMPLPGHTNVLQSLICEESPAQPEVLQVRVLVRDPVPHDVVHVDQAPHVFHVGYEAEIICTATV